MENAQYMHTNVKMSVWPGVTLAMTVEQCEIEMNNLDMVRHSQAEEAKALIYTLHRWAIVS